LTTNRRTIFAATLHSRPCVPGPSTGNIVPSAIHDDYRHSWLGSALRKRVRHYVHMAELCHWHTVPASGPKRLTDLHCIRRALVMGPPPPQRLWNMPLQRRLDNVGHLLPPTANSFSWRSPCLPLMPGERCIRARSAAPYHQTCRHLAFPLPADGIRSCSPSYHDARRATSNTLRT